MTVVAMTSHAAEPTARIVPARRCPWYASSSPSITYMSATSSLRLSASTVVTSSSHQRSRSEAKTLRTTRTGENASGWNSKRFMVATHGQTSQRNAGIDATAGEAPEARASTKSAGAARARPIAWAMRIPVTPRPSQ